jgi:hypothetical protein
VEYEAISYYWGGHDPAHKDSTKIEVEDHAKQVHTVFIRTHLCSGLISLRHPTEVRDFWVDALCINRSDSNEVNNQVAMKFRIFHKAQNQCFWLGNDEDLRKALDFVPAILDIPRIDVLVRDPRSIRRWEAFLTLINDVAFSRLWLVQEVIAAQNTSLHCDSAVIQYSDFVDAVALFVSYRSDLIRLFRHNGQPSRTLIGPRIAITERFIDVTTNALRVLKPNQEIQWRFSLADLVSLLGDLSCTDPRDRIYSVLAFANDMQPHEGTTTDDSRVLPTDQPLRIDYTRDFVDVFRDFVLHAITQSQSLDIICRPWALAIPEREVKLPTWVRPLQSSFPLFDTGGRRYGDSLVGLPAQKCYNASRNFPVSWEKISNSSICVKGIRIDTITQLGPRASEGIIFYEWLELGGCRLAEDGNYIPERFWRTLVGDHGPHFSRPPSWYHRALLHCLAMSADNPDINTSRLIAEVEVESSRIADFLRRVQSVIWNRKFLVCSEGDLIGLAPTVALPGDVVCILFGCSVPVLLRPARGADGRLLDSTKAPAFWNVVGECYIHGIMDGEGIDLESMDKDENFELR